MLKGTEEMIVSPSYIKQFYDNVGSKDKKLIVLEGFHHELHQEKERKKFFETIKNSLQCFSPG